jgi:hypothetical protein
MVDVFGDAPPRGVEFNEMGGVGRLSLFPPAASAAVEEAAANVDEEDGVEEEEEDAADDDADDDDENEDEDEDEGEGDGALCEKKLPSCCTCDRGEAMVLLRRTWVVSVYVMHTRGM